MSAYHNDKYGFEIDLPSGWGTTSGLSRIPFILSNLFMRANILEEFSFDRHEFLNIVVEQMRPEVPPDINQLVFTIFALKNKYTDLKFGRIIVGGREHAWVCYVMNGKGWLKKYMIVLNGYGFALTASCPVEHRSPSMEETWDRIATSLRLLKPIDQSIIDFNNSPQVKHSVEMLRQELIRQLEAQRRQ